MRNFLSLFSLLVFKRTFAAVVIYRLLVASVLIAAGPAHSQSFDESIYVNVDTGSDENPGTETKPLRTIQEAMDRATNNKNSGLSTKVNIAKGIYREEVTFSFSNYDGGGTNAAVVVEGAGPKKTVLKGSDEYTGWSDEGGGVYSHSWTNNWGVSDDPTGGYVTDCDAHPTFCAKKPDLVLRREMVFVNGERMDQVLTSDNVEPGTFRIEEGVNKIFLQPPPGTVPSAAKIEVAERENGWKTRHENNFTLRGMRVEHYATPWQNGNGAVVIAEGSHNTVENIEIVQNNWDGLRPRGENFTLRNFKLNDNGHSGLEPFRVRTFSMEDGEVNRNNWRGALGGYTGWTPGNKFFKSRDVTIRNVDFINNDSVGLWFDNDHKNLLIERVTLKDNLKHGIFLEQMQGPTTLNNVVIAKNNEFGALISDTENTTIKNSEIKDNTHGGFNLTGTSGGGGRTFTNFVTGDSQTVRLRGLTLNDNIIQGVEDPQTGTPGRYLIGGTLYDTWSDFVSTYEANGNRWYDSDDTAVFQWRKPNELIDLEEWKSRTGEDQNSVFGKLQDSIPLQSGWNIISSPVQPRDSILKEVFSDLRDVVGLVRNEAGERFVPGSGENTIGAWHSKEAYEVYAERTDTLQLRGRRLSSGTTYIPLDEGWNLVPYLVGAPNPTEDVFKSIAADLIVKDENGQVYIPSSGVDQISQLRPGRGYKVYVTEKTILEYPPAVGE